MKIQAQIASGIVIAFALTACGGSDSGSSSSSSELATGSAGTHAAILPLGEDAGCAGVGSVICLNGGHWDPTLCRCVPPATCGSTACGVGQTCCDEPGADGVCAPRCVTGHLCPEIACRAPVPDAGCVDNVLCIAGDHWDSTLCKCVPDATRDAGCVDNVLCIAGDHWDSTLCKCVPDEGTCGSTAH